MTLFTLKYNDELYLCANMTVQIYNQLYSQDISVYHPCLEQKCLILVSGHPKFEEFVNEEKFEAMFLALAVDPSIGWHRNIIESQLIMDI